MDMEMVQIKGVDSTHRITKAELAEGATMIVHERLMTHGDQVATSVYEVKLQGYFARWLCLRLKQQGLANGANGQGQYQTKSIKNFFIGEIAV